MVLDLINFFNLSFPDHMLNNHPMLNIFKYLTVRAGLALMTSFWLIIFFGPTLINWISSFQKDGQPIREDGPQSHLIAKKGTPTMGGLIILSSIIISILLWSNFDAAVMWPVALCNNYVWLPLQQLCVNSTLQLGHYLNP